MPTVIAAPGDRQHCQSCADDIPFPSIRPRLSAAFVKFWRGMRRRAGMPPEFFSQSQNRIDGWFVLMLCGCEMTRHRLSGVMTESAEERVFRCSSGEGCRYSVDGLQCARIG